MKYELNKQNILHLDDTLLSLLNTTPGDGKVLRSAVNRSGDLSYDISLVLFRLECLRGLGLGRIFFSASLLRYVMGTTADVPVNMHTHWTPKNFDLF